MKQSLLAELVCSAEGSPAGLAARLTFSDLLAVSQGASSGAGRGRGDQARLSPASPCPQQFLLVTLLKRQLLCGLCAGVDLAVFRRAAPCSAAVV